MPKRDPLINFVRLLSVLAGKGIAHAQHAGQGDLSTPPTPCIQAAPLLGPLRHKPHNCKRRQATKPLDRSGRCGGTDSCNPCLFASVASAELQKSRLTSALLCACPASAVFEPWRLHAAPIARTHAHTLARWHASTRD